VHTTAGWPPADMAKRREQLQTHYDVERKVMGFLSVVLKFIDGHVEGFCVIGKKGFQFHFHGGHIDESGLAGCLV
jgi:hypothetical protein